MQRREVTTRLKVVSYSLLILASILTASKLFSQARDTDLEVVLKKYLQFSASDTAGIVQGRVFAKMLDSKEKREVAGLGIIRVNVSHDEFLKRYRDIDSFKQSPDVLQIGKFSDPAKLSDISALTFERGDLDELKVCKVGDCAVKLPAKMITQLSDSLHSGSASEAKANELFQKFLVDYVNDYMQKGDQSLTTYEHDKHPLSISDDFKSLVNDNGFLKTYAPEFAKFILDYPKSELPGAESFVYWSKEKFGLKPVISITQIIICPRKAENRNELLIATKQLFADHYFDSSLGFAIFVEQPASSTLPGNYLIYMNQSRADALKGFMTGLRRSVVESRSLTALKNNMKITKQRLERPVVKTQREGARNH